MPAPFIVLAGMGLMGGYGVKKGLDGLEASNEADKIQNEAEKKYETAKKKLQRKRDATANSIKRLGELKLNAASNEIREFAEEFSKIKELVLLESEGLDELEKILFTSNDLKELKEISMNASKILFNTIGSGIAGALLGYGAYGAVGMLGTAGTGAAISGLSGAAATNATLAWLGGGTLAAGGGGVALGTVVLGGLIAGPALLLAGSLFKSKANTKLDNAKINKVKAIQFSIEVDTAVIELSNIQRTANDIYNIIEKLKNLSKAANVNLKLAIKKNGTNWKEYNQEGKEAVFVAVKAVQVLKAAIDVPLLTDDGQLTAVVRAFVKQSKKALKKMD